MNMDRSFIEAVGASLNARGQGIEARYAECKKNGVLFSGLSMGRPGQQVRPTFYITQELCDEFWEEDDLVKAVADHVLSLFEKYEVSNNTADRIVSSIVDWSWASGHIMPVLIGEHGMDEGVAAIPLCEGLSLGFRLIIDKNEGVSSVLVRRDLMETWGVSVDELRAAAISNQGLLGGPKVMDIAEVLKEMGAGLLSPSVSPSPEFTMCVVSNAYGVNGAAVILYPGVAENVREVLGVGEGEAFVIIPSSINEVIAVSITSLGSSDLRQMIEDVNATSLPPEEVLSDRPYLYRDGSIEPFCAEEKAAS